MVGIRPDGASVGRYALTAPPDHERGPREPCGCAKEAVAAGTHNCVLAPRLKMDAASLDAAHFYVFDQQVA